MSSPFSLEGKVAIVTGLGRGIGKTTALMMAQAGAAVTVLARTAADVENTRAEIRAQGGKPWPYPRTSESASR